MDLIYVFHFIGTRAILTALPAITNLSDIRNTHNFTCLSLELIHRVGAIESLTDLFKSGTSGLDEEEVDSDELDDQPALKEEIELPAASVNSKWDGVLR